MSLGTTLKELLRSKQIWQLAALGVFLIVGLFVARQFPVLQWIESFRLWAAQFGILGIFMYGGVFGLMVILMLPCLPLTVLAGFTFGMGGGMVAVYTGITISAAFGFLFARYIARGAVAEQIERHPRFKAIDGAIAKEGWKIVGLLRMCPVPLGLTNYLYGLTAIPFWRYMAATLVGLLPPNLLLVYLGAFGKRTVEGPRDPLEYALGGLALVALVCVVIVLRRIAVRATSTAEPAES